MKINSKKPVQKKETKSAGRSAEELILSLAKLVTQRDEISEVIKQEKYELKLLSSPFEVGTDVMFEVPAGKTRKVTKCKFELEFDTAMEEWYFYARPYKPDGELSGRHFYIMNPANQCTVAEV